GRTTTSPCSIARRPYFRAPIGVAYTSQGSATRPPPAQDPAGTGTLGSGASGRVTGSGATTGRASSGVGMRISRFGSPIAPTTGLLSPVPRRPPRHRLLLYHDRAVPTTARAGAHGASISNHTVLPDGWTSVPHLVASASTSMIPRPLGVSRSGCCNTGG